MNLHIITFRTYCYIEGTLKDAKDHKPLKAFNVEVNGSIDRVLARLPHTYEVWGYE